MIIEKKSYGMVKSLMRIKIQLPSKYIYKAYGMKFSPLCHVMRKETQETATVNLSCD
jgi:hypothetical protein